MRHRTNTPNDVAHADPTAPDQASMCWRGGRAGGEGGWSGDAERGCWIDGTGSLGVEDRGDRFDPVDESRTGTHDEGVGVESPHLCALGQYAVSDDR